MLGKIGTNKRFVSAGEIVVSDERMKSLREKLGAVASGRSDKEILHALAIAGVIMAELRNRDVLDVAIGALEPLDWPTNA